MPATLSATDADAAVRCALTHCRSLEDLRLLPLLRAAAEHDARPGSFLEMGAFDGESESQTWLLEKCYGWRGLLIEGSPLNYAALKKANREGGTQRLFSSVCNTTGKVAFRIKGDQRAGLAQFGATLGPKAVRGEKKYVPCRPLPQILEQANLPRVTYFSLDVEGAEKLVMQTLGNLMTPSTFPFSVVMFEDNQDNFKIKTNRFFLESQANTRAVMEMLERSGLVELPLPAYRTSRNRLYVRSGLVDARPTGARLDRAERAAYALLQDESRNYSEWKSNPFLVRNSMEQMPRNRTSWIASRLAMGMPDAVLSLHRHHGMKRGHASPL